MALRQIKPGELGHFSIDEDTNRLYWDNKAVQTESVVVLSAKQTFWGIAIAVATILGAIATCTYTGTYVWFTFNPRVVNIQKSVTDVTQSPCAVVAPEKTPAPPNTTKPVTKPTSLIKQR
jgi:hypothetical protein